MYAIGMTSLLAVALAGSAAVPDWSALSDQRGQPMAAPVAPFVVVVVAPRRARELRAWEERLRALEPRPDVLRVVDVPEGGRADEVARTLRKRAPAGVAIAVDAGRTVARALGLTTGDTQVLVLDAEGHVVHRVAGRANERTAAAVGAAWAAVRTP
jgi:hypothetical protein